MTYTQADYQTVLELVTPTPERVATAKAWIAEHRSDHAQWGPEGAESEFAVSQGELDPAQINSRDPANQDQMIRWTQWAGAFRSAISEFERAGLLVPVFQSTPDSPAQSGWGFFTRSVGVPLGSPGENVTPSPLPLPLIYAMYAWSPLTETEKKRRLELYDADLYMVKANLQKFEERAQRCVSEALACYRSDLFLASATCSGLRARLHGMNSPRQWSLTVWEKHNFKPNSRGRHRASRKFRSWRSRTCAACLRRTSSPALGFSDQLLILSATSRGIGATCATMGCIQLVRSPLRRSASRVSAFNSWARLPTSRSCHQYLRD